MDPNRITYFAETDARNKRVQFGIKAKDRLKHVYVIGKTGMGKSTLLENMAIQDIQNGEGVAFIDPHGVTAEKLLDYVPENRVKDVLYFAPFDLDYPVSFNIMEDVGPEKRHLVVAGLMATFEKIWADAWSARMAYILQNTLLALLEFPGATLLGVNRMYTDKEFRKQVVDNITDVAVKSFWVDEYTKYTDRYTQEATPAIQNKIGQFASNPLIRNIIGQPKSTFDLRKIMDEKKILIMNLSKGLVGEGNAKLLGSMLITKIYLAAMSRADLPSTKMASVPNFYFYVDEFQSFANRSFADILSEARKYKLNLTIAHQYIEQMEEEVRDAVFGNVGTMIVFRVGAFDAEVLEKEFAPTFEATDLVNLGFAQIYLKLMIDGISSKPFSATTIAPIPQPEPSFKDIIIRASRERFAVQKSSVEQNITKWHEVSTLKENQKNSQNEIKKEYKPIPSANSYPEQKPREYYQPQSQPQYQNKTNYQNYQNEKRTQENYHRHEVPVHTEVRKIDENKEAFIKAKEELIQKEKMKAPTTAYNPTYSKEKISLSDLNKKDEILNQASKKNPSKENMSSLKEALSSVINKPKSDRKKDEEKTEVKSKHDIGKENPQERKEVPESVLKSLLSMEDSK